MGVIFAIRSRRSGRFKGIPIAQSLLLRAQKNSALLEANSDNLDKNQTSLAKGIWPGNGDTTEDKDAD